MKVPRATPHMLLHRVLRALDVLIVRSLSPPPPLVVSPPSKFKFFMKYMFGACCASMEHEQELLVRMHRIEQKLDIHSAPPHDLEPLCDPFDLYDKACKEFYGELSDQPRRHGKQQAGIENEEYIKYDDDDDDDGGDDGDHDGDEDYEDE